MALRENFEQSGQWLFRWRSYLPLVCIPVIILAFLDYKHLGTGRMADYIWEMVCLLVSFFGLAIRCYTIGQTPKGTSGRNTKKQIANTLNTTGAYSIVRNPLYLGNFFMVLGIVLFLHLWWLVLIYVLAFWLYYERIIFTEEEYLRSKFGDEYLAWADYTPAFIPSFRHYKKSELPFSFKNVLKREYNGLFAVIACMFLLDMVGELVVSHKLSFDLVWFGALAFGFLVWMTLRTIRKRSKLFKVSGR